MLFRFGTVRLDVERRQLLREGREQSLQPKAFELLRVLVAARPRVLSKSEIMDLIWPEVYVSEANVAILIGEIRAAIGDPARAPVFIRTHFGVGYSFVGEVVELARPVPTVSGPTFVLSIGERRIVLFQGETSVGRDASNEIRISHPSVSRRHARFRIDGQRAWIEDLESKNGTKLDGERLDGMASVQTGAELCFGKVRATITLATATELSTLTVARLDTSPGRDAT